MKVATLIFILLTISSCFKEARIDVTGEENNATLEDSNGKNENLQIKLEKVSVEDNKLVIDGSGLAPVTAVKLKLEKSESVFTIESLTESQIIATSVENITLVLDSALSLVMSNAEGAEVAFSLNLSLDDKSITASKLNNMGADDGNILIYNKTNDLWEPKEASALPINDPTTTMTGLIQSTAVGDSYFTGGNLGVGTTHPVGPLHVVGNALYLERNSDNGKRNSLAFRKSRGSLEAPTSVQNGDSLSSIWAFGYDGNAYKTSAMINMYVDGEPGPNDMPGRISFFTVPDDSTGAKERMVIKNDGKVGVGTTSPEGQFDVFSDESNNISLSGGNINQHLSWAGGQSIYVHSDTSWRGPHLNYYKSRGTQLAPTIVSSGDTLMSTYYAGYDGSAYMGAAHFNVFAEGDWSTASKGAGFRFETLSKDTSSWGERVRISSNGNVGIATSNPIATLDVNGFAKLKKYSAEPAACDGTYDGSLALTSTYYLCVCNSSSWVKASDGVTACVW